MPVKKPMTAGNRFKGRFKTLCRWISSKKLLFPMLQKGYKSLENFKGYSKMATLLGWRSRRGYNWVLTDRVEVLLCGGRRRGDFRRGWENAEAAKRVAAWQCTLAWSARALFLPPGIIRATKPSQRSGSESYKTATLFPAHSSSTP